MSKYSTQNLRNISVLGHGGAGKTSLTEAMLYCAGVADRIGKVADGNTVSDYDAEEVKRKCSISTSVAPLEWKGKLINVLDTPGYFDYVGEVLSAVRVADAAVIVLSGKSGVKVGTEKVWKYAAKKGIPRMVFINKMEEERADFYSVLNQLRETFGKTIAPFQTPVFDGEKFIGMVNVVDRTCRVLEGDKVVEKPMPEAYRDKVEEVRGMIIESVAETSEELMARYFDGEEFTIEEINHALRAGVSNGSIVPVLCGSSFTTVGVRALMEAICEYFPAPGELGDEIGQSVASDDLIERKVSDDEPTSLFVFKTVADPYVGKLSVFRVMSGVVKADTVLRNISNGENEKIGHLYRLCGKKQTEVKEIGAGDIGAVTKLAKTGTGDTLSVPAAPILYDKIDFPKPSMSMSIVPKAKGDEEKISSGIARMMEEDPTLAFKTDKETKETIISGLGDQHLEVVVAKLQSKFGVGVELKVPKVAYREAIRKPVKVEGKHKKQSGGHGQYGHVWIEFEPTETDTLIFEEKVFGGAVPKNFFPAVEKGLLECMNKGVLAGFPVVNLKATLVDGSYHDVDSSEMAFKMAAHIAFKKGLESASPYLLEPISHMEIVVPDAYMGDVVGDLNKRRGRILGMNPMDGGLQQVVAEVPSSEIFRYTIELRSMTQGRGDYDAYFERYEEAPEPVAQKVIATYKKDDE